MGRGDVGSRRREEGMRRESGGGRGGIRME
jgi:hypothetical protein